MQNDPETLQSVLTWGAKTGLTPATGEDDSQERQHGYRRKSINKEEKEEDQVKKF